MQEKNYTFFFATNSSFFSSLEPCYSFNVHTVLMFTEQELCPVQEGNRTHTKSDWSHICKVFISSLHTFSLISTGKQESGESYASHKNLLASARLKKSQAFCFHLSMVKQQENSTNWKKN